MSERRKRRYLIDRAVQTTLLVRTASYWLFSMLTVGMMLVVWEVFAGPRERSTDVLTATIVRYGPALLVSLLLLPLVMFDVLRMSHRFVGPVMRLRQGLRELATGRRPATMKFREDDFWREMAGEFNAAAEQIEETRDALVSTRMTNSLS